MKSFFSPKEVAQVTGFSSDRTASWDKRGLLRPSYRRKGKYRLYTFQDLIGLEFIRLLLHNGYSIYRVYQPVFALQRLLPSVHHPLIDLTIMVEKTKDPTNIAVFNGEVSMTGPMRDRFMTLSVSDVRKLINKTFDED